MTVLIKNWFRIGLNADPDLVFSLNADPYPSLGTKLNFDQKTYQPTKVPKSL